MNTLAYIIYLLLTGLITFYVGRMCYTHGFPFIKETLQNDHLAQAVNNLLLIGYYLVNLGYVVFSLSDWEYIVTLPMLVSAIAKKAGWIITLLAILHYINIFTLLTISKTQIFTNKN